MSVESLVFEDDPVAVTEWSVKVRGVDYILKRAYGDVAERYKTEQTKGVEFDAVTRKSKQNLNVGALDSLLLSWLMHTAPNGDGKTQPVPRQVILSWEPKTIEKLANFARQKSGLATEDTIESLMAEKDVIERKLSAMRANPDPLAGSSKGTMDGSD